jgi:hypothetical protein
MFEFQTPMMLGAAKRAGVRGASEENSPGESPAGVN